VAVFLVGWSGDDLEPSILSIESAETKFGLAGLPCGVETAPPFFKLTYVVGVKDRLPVSAYALPHETAVILKSQIDKFRGAIRQSGPDDGRNAVDKCPEFQRDAAVVITPIHRRIR
jgi:hypothetical protein